MRLARRCVKPYMFVIYAVLVLIMVVFSFTPYSNAAAIGSIACAADGIRYIAWERCRIPCIIWISISFILIRKESYNLMEVVLIGDRKKRWKKDACQALLYSLVTSLVILMASLVVLYIVYGSNWMNWSAENSFAKAYTRMETADYSVICMIVLMWLIYYMQITTALLVMLLGYYVFNNYIAGLIAVIAVGINDMRVLSFKLYFGRLAILREQWLFLNFKDMYIYIIMLLILIVLYYAGLCISRKKEFLDVEVDKA